MPTIKIPVSVCVITYNEENRIRKALESVKWVDEILVVDSLSADKTREIARQYTGRVISNPRQGYVKQRNLAQQLATNQWILELDPHEYVSPELAEEIKKIFQKNPIEYDGFLIKKKAFYLGKWIEHSGWYPDAKIRLYRKENGRWDGSHVHEYLNFQGRVGRLRGDILHHPYWSIKHHLEMIDKYTALGAKSYLEKQQKFRLRDLLLRPPATFFKKFLLKQGFLDGYQGLIIAALSSYGVFLKYLKIWEYQNIKSATVPKNPT